MRCLLNYNVWDKGRVEEVYRTRLKPIHDHVEADDDQWLQQWWDSEQV